MRHASVGLRSLERAENVDRYKTLPWRHLDFRAEVDMRRGLIHGTSARCINLYSDKIDQVFAALQRVGWPTYRRCDRISYFRQFPHSSRSGFSFLPTSIVPASSTQQK